MGKKNKKKEPLLSGDTKFVLVVVLLAVLLLATIVFFGKGDKEEVVEEPVNIDTSNQVSIGNTESSVEVVQFFDFQCVHCQDWEQQVYPELNEKYIQNDKIKYTLINFPFLGKASENAALLFETVNGVVSSEKAFEFKKEIFSEVARLGEDSGKVFYDKNLLATVEKITTDEEYTRIEESYDNKEFSPALDIDSELVSSSNVLGTPSIFVNNKFIENGANPDVLFEEIDNAIENTK